MSLDAARKIEPASRPMVQVHRLSKVYPGGVEALSGISVDFPEGQLTSLLGPSGCGKTTLLKIIAGLIPATSGLVEVDGRPVAKRSAQKISRGGRKAAIRRHKSTGTAVEEVIYTVDGPVPDSDEYDRALQIPLVRAGQTVDDLPTLDDARARLRRALVSLPWEGLKLSHGEPAIPTLFL